GLAVFHYTTLFRSISRKALTSVPVWPKDQMVKATAVAAVISPAPRCQLRSGPRKPVGPAASVVFWAGVPGIVEIPRSEEEGRPEACGAPEPRQGRGHCRPRSDGGANVGRAPLDITAARPPLRPSRAGSVARAGGSGAMPWPPRT